MNFALHIIAYNEVDSIKNIYNKYVKYFNEVAVAVDDQNSYEELKRISETEDYKYLSVFKYDWDEDEKRLGFPKFDKKRNFLVDNIKSEYYLRLDTDDEIDHPELLPEVFLDIVNKNMDVVYSQYEYAKDQDGNTNARHWRETFVKKSTNYRWNKKIHENVLVTDQSKFRGIKDKRISIIHHIDSEHAEKSAQRNFKILLDEFNQDKANCDPRTVAYIGRMLMGWGEWKKAIPFLEILIKKSGWNDDKYFAYVHIAQCYANLNEHEMAIAACNEALTVNTSFPDAYLQLCEIYVSKGDYQKAIDWGTIGLQKPEPDTMFVLDPSVYTVRSAMNLAMAFLGVGNAEKAKAFYDKAFQFAPNQEFIKSKKELFDLSYENAEYTKHLSWIYSYVKSKDPARMRSLVESIPKNMLRDERMVTLRNRYVPSTTWDDKSVVFYCHETLFEWAAPSVISGIGGSEEAVIYLSQELTKLGYKVTVYCNCGELKGTYSGVEYKEFFEFNRNDNFNILVSWRQNIFSGEIKAKRKLVWLHDVPDAQQFARWFSNTDVDKVIVLSNFHKSIIPDYFDHNRIFVSSNGINLKDFDGGNEVRNPYRMIYTSSYDRGVQHILQMWPDIRKEIPEAELHIFYGWNTFDKFIQIGARTSEFKSEMIKLMSQPGVTEHGRVGHKQLIREFKKSKFWVYPSHFEEISCISAMKAQACGCVPVCTNYAALAETVKGGVIIDGKLDNEKTYEDYKNALIKALKEQPEFSIDKTQFGWDKVALQWKNELFQ